VTRRGNGEGSVYFEPDRQKWCVSIKLPEGKRQRFRFDTKQPANRKLRDALQAKDHGLPIPTDQLTVRQFLADWLEQTIKPGRRKGTYLRYETVVRLHIVPLIGKAPVARLGPQDVQRLQTALLAKGLGAKYINLVRATLSGAMSQAVKFGLALRNPVPLVDPPHEEEEEPRPLTPEQAGALLSAAAGHDFEHLFTVMLASGLRIGEALGLRWPDVDLDKRRLQVRQQLTIITGEPWRLTPPKSKSGRRTLPLIPAAIEALHHQRPRVLRYQAKLPHELPWPEHGLVFCDEFGNPLVGRRVERVFKQLLERAVLSTTFTPHSLRHSTATYLTAMGVPPRVIMEIMGHSSLSMTTKYQHVMEGMLDDAADRLASIFPAAAI
jgi:integrase